jgi:hypothetical protein
MRRYGKRSRYQNRPLKAMSCVTIINIIGQLRFSLADGVVAIEEHLMFLAQRLRMP